MKCAKLKMPIIILLVSLYVGHALADDIVADDIVVDADSVSQYVLSCRKPNGAFGPRDQEYTDAAWNYPAVQTLTLLNKSIENREAVLKHGLGFPTGHGGYGHWLFFHQQMTRKLLKQASSLKGKEVKLVQQGYKAIYYGSPFGSDSNLMFQANQKMLAEHIDRATQLQYYNLSSLYYLLAAVDAAGMRVSNADDLVAFINARQSANGGFVDVRVEDGKPTDREAHIAHTFHAVSSLGLLSSDVPNSVRCEQFIHSCQQATGAFRWNGAEGLPGNYSDIYYTWAAIRSLDELKRKPNMADQCVDWINSLQNADGGFGDQPSWRSRLYSTYYATDALGVLCTDAKTGIKSKRLGRPGVEIIKDDEFKVFQGLHKMPVCTVAELAELRRRKFNLIALKSSDFAVATTLLKSIRATQQPLDVVLCPESYSHRLRRHGGVTLDHVANFTLDANWSEEQRAKWQAADLQGPNRLLWKDYQQKVIGPAQQLGSLVYPEHEFEMEYGYSAYDDGVYKKNGYNAVLAGFNWEPHDFVRVFPWRERYVDKLTPIADADAHGDLKKWSPHLNHTRHLFLAKNPTYAGFLDAAANGRVVCVIQGAEGVPTGVTYYGRKPSVDYVKQRLGDWKWWADE
jgi:prenyltransferase beta subunit